MKKTTIVGILTCLFLVASCGWSPNQKEAAKTSIGDGFTKGLSSTGATVDEKVKKEWVDCVIKKASEKWTFDEFSALGGAEMEALQEKCAEDVGLYEAIVQQ